MHFTTVALAASPLLAFVAAYPSSLESRQFPSKQCSHITGGVHVIAAPGEGSADPPYGLIGSLARSILTAIPGSTNVSVPYNHTETNGLMQTQDGAETMLRYVKQYHQACPNTKIVLLGYSAGAVMAMNVMCGESPPYNPALDPLPKDTYGTSVIAAIAYGDESRTAGSRWSVGTCKGVGIHPRANPDGCKTWGKRIKNYCDSTDPLCCATTGTNMTTHYDYPSKYDQVATRFVVRQLREAGGA